MPAWQSDDDIDNQLDSVEQYDIYALKNATTSGFDLDSDLDLEDWEVDNGDSYLDVTSEEDQSYDYSSG